MREKERGGGLGERERGKSLTGSMFCFSVIFAFISLAPFLSCALRYSIYGLVNIDAVVCVCVSVSVCVYLCIYLTRSSSPLTFFYHPQLYFCVLVFEAGIR